MITSIHFPSLLDDTDVGAGGAPAGNPYGAAPAPGGYGGYGAAPAPGGGGGMAANPFDMGGAPPPLPTRGGGAPAPAPAASGNPFDMF